MSPLEGIRYNLVRWLGSLSVHKRESTSRVVTHNNNDPGRHKSLEATDVFY